MKGFFGDIRRIMQNTKYAILLLFIIIISGYVPVLASPPAPTPLCRITGVIKSVTFKDAYDEPCLQEPRGCPTDMELQHPARYYLDVSINSVAYVSGETKFSTCSNIYPPGSTKNIFINKDKVKTGDIFSARQQIAGIVRSFWGSSFDSYDLMNEFAEGTNLDTSEISEKLVRENYVNKVVNISLQTDEKTYQVTASKNGKLFSIIPVWIPLQLTVDATNSEVITIKKPWWAFLVRY